MKITGIRYADGELHLACDPRDGIQATHKLEAGKEYDILPHKEKRSLNANAYAWAMIHKIAAAIGISPIEVYRNTIRQLPDKAATFVSIFNEAAPAFIKSWEEGHIGRQAEQIGEDCGGYVTLRLVFGSSDFSRAEMARFIDLIIQDAQALGIETKDPEDVKSLLSRWK